MKIKKIAFLAILTTVAVTIYLVEMWIPLPVPLPGVKLGLANIVTLFVVFSSNYKPKDLKDFKIVSLEPPMRFNISDAIIILILRIFLGLLLTARVMSAIYSLSGGLLAFIAVLCIKRVVSEKQIWVAGVIGAIFHNIGQIIVAVIITGTPQIIGYLPVLIISAIFSGILTGFITQFVILRISHNKSVDI